MIIELIEQYQQTDEFRHKYFQLINNGHKNKIEEFGYWNGQRDALRRAIEELERVLGAKLRLEKSSATLHCPHCLLITSPSDLIPDIK